MKQLEIEIKAYCDDLEQVVQEVKKLGGKYLKTQNESDIYFNHPLKDFKITDEALRIRTINDKSILTYKGPKVSKQSKARIEEETELLDKNQMMIILKQLGYQIGGKVEKKRDYYLLSGIEICCDEIMELGSFIELEKKGNDIKKIETDLYKLAEKLNLNKFERRSYLELKMEKAQKTNQT